MAETERSGSRPVLREELDRSHSSTVRLHHERNTGKRPLFGARNRLERRHADIGGTAERREVYGAVV